MLIPIDGIYKFFPVPEVHSNLFLKDYHPLLSKLEHNNIIN